jgi:hypothetical protein
MSRSLSPPAPQNLSFLSSAIDRLRAIIPATSFTFVINDTEVPCDIFDAAFLSPAVHQHLSTDALSHHFVINDSLVEADDFVLLQTLITGDPVTFLKSSRRSLVFLCQRLCNPELERFFATLWSTEDSATITLLDILSSRPRPSIDDISFLSFGTLDDLLSRDALQVESENRLLMDLIELGPLFAPLLRHVHFELLSPEGVLFFAQHFFYRDLTDAVWEAIVERLKRTAPSSGSKTTAGQSKMSVPPRLDSRVISEFPSLFSEFAGRVFRLLYRGSRDGFGAANFHEKCDGHANTLVVIQDRNRYVFGGYTPLEWESRNRTVQDVYKCDDILKGFVFTLKNPHNTTAKKFSLKSDQKSRAICCDLSLGPTFGVADLLVADNCNANSNSHTSNLGLTYNNYTGLDGKLFFTGSANFRVKEIEVFQITD